MMRRLLPAVFALSTTFAAPAAFADNAPGSTEMREAETRFHEGLALYAQGHINEARVKLVQAYAVLGRTNILWNLSVAEFYSSRFLDSVRHMRAFVRAPDADQNDVAVAKKQFLPELEKQTGRIDIRASRGSTIAVDGDEFGPAPLDEAVDVLPGRHMVLARTPGGNATKSVSVRAGQIVPVAIGEGAEASGPVGDSRSSDKGGGGSSSAKTVTVIALGAGAVLAAGAGLVFTLTSSSHSSDAKDLTAKIRGESGGDSSACAGTTNPDCSALHDANNARDRDMGLATGFFIGAGVLAVGTVLSYFLWPSGGSKTTAGLTDSHDGLRFQPDSKLTFHF